MAIGTLHQLSKLRCQSVTLSRCHVSIQISTAPTCLGVLLDSALTFAPHVRRLYSKCFYHLRQINTVRISLTEDAAKTKVHTFVISRVDYCKSILHRVSAVHVQPVRDVLNAAPRIILCKRQFDHITADLRDQLQWMPVQQRI